MIGLLKKKLKYKVQKTSHVVSWCKSKHQNCLSSGTNTLPEGHFFTLVLLLNVLNQMMFALACYNNMLYMVYGVISLGRRLDEPLVVLKRTNQVCEF